jgi:hypothetical protein
VELRSGTTASFRNQAVTRAALALRINNNDDAASLW